MTATNTKLQGTGPVLRTRAVGILAWLLSAMPFAASADNVLQDINFVPGEGGRVDITLQLDNPSSDAQVFTTDDPPRIAIDLPDTRNAVEKRRLQVGQGSTSAISAVEAAGRTRVVIDLFRSASYETRLEGNNLIVSVAGTTSSNYAVATSSMVTTKDPSKRVAGALELVNVDFRRTAEGAGRVVLQFNGEGAAADLRTEGSRVVVDLPGIQVPVSQVQKLDVVDFATPVQTVEANAIASGGRVTLTNSGTFESMAYQSGNEYVVEIAKPAEVANSTNSAKSLLPGEEETYVGKPVTFNFQDIPVRTVLQLIAEESGLNVVAADTVTGNVTLRLINVPWDQALNIVLRAKGLDQRREGNVVWIAPQPEIASYEQAKADARLALEQRAALVTEYIPINYGNAEEIASLLTEEALQGEQGGGQGQQAQQRGFLSPRGSVSFDKRTNTLLLNETPEKIAELRSLITLLDRPVDQVLIEARIVIAREEFARELGAKFGISGGYEDNHGNIVTTTGSLNGANTMTNVALRNRFAGQGSGLPIAAPGPVGGGVLVPNINDRLNVNLPVTSPAGAIGFAILGADHLIDLELSALESEGRGEVVSSPRVITSNQREARIRQGDEIGYLTLQQAQGGGIPQFTTAFKEVLLELVVTPTITQDGRVYMTLAVKKDEVSGFLQSPQGDIPQIAKRDISTAVLVEDGQTVVIGGVYEFSSSEDVRKVPFLGDVPFLGNLFKTKGRDTGKAELLIFVTPKVLNVAGARKG